MGRRVATVFVAAIVSASCAGDRSAEPGATASSADPAPAKPPSSALPSDPQTTDGTVAVPEILRFSAPRLGGGEVVGAAYAGKPLALWFWAPW